MADFIVSMIAEIFTLIICAFALYASIISFSLFDYAFRWFVAFWHCVFVRMHFNINRRYDLFLL
ncbi:hypothetical protein Lpp124_10153 [Lacticaseibacillus paracasei subsp. paracasei CNCM I-4649]|nr:hypothetical protein Lpp124_10153 [Lacticaseibacillus paracasei subsp. paracasei CNCM I-4649]